MGAHHDRQARAAHYARTCCTARGTQVYQVMRELRGIEPTVALR